MIRALVAATIAAVLLSGCSSFKEERGRPSVRAAPHHAAKATREKIPPAEVAPVRRAEPAKKRQHWWQLWRR